MIVLQLMSFTWFLLSFYTFDITHHELTFFYKGKIQYIRACFNIKLIFLFFLCVKILYYLLFFLIQ